MNTPPSKNQFFVYPRVQKQDEIHTLIASLDAFRQSLVELDRDLVSTLISYADMHSSQSHLLPHLTPFEFVLLAMVIEQQRELAKEKNPPPEHTGEFIHPPFP